MPNQHDNKMTRAAAAKTYEALSQPKPTPSQAPYLLDSGVFIEELKRQSSNASSEIEAIMAEILDIETRANNDIASIAARRDSEKAAREARRMDLAKIVEMTARAMGETK